jgi:hypothetical protein
MSENNLDAVFMTFVLQLRSSDAVAFFEGLKNEGKVSLGDSNNLVFDKLSAEESLTAAKFMTTSDFSSE